MNKSNEVPNTKPPVKLPEDAARLLNDIYVHAQVMCNSKNSLRVKKGQLLEQFVFDIKLQKGHLEDIYSYIKRFSRDTENMKLLTSRRNKLYDFFSCKTATESEKKITLLKMSIKEHMNSVSAYSNSPN